MASNRSESRPCSVGSCCCRYKRRGMTVSVPAIAGVTEAARFSDRVASPCRRERNPRNAGASWTSVRCSLVSESGSALRVLRIDQPITLGRVHHTAGLGTLRERRRSSGSVA